MNGTVSTVNTVSTVWSARRSWRQVHGDGAIVTSRTGTSPSRPPGSSWPTPAEPGRYSLGCTAQAPQPCQRSASIQALPWPCEAATFPSYRGWALPVQVLKAPSRYTAGDGVQQ